MLGAFGVVGILADGTRDADAFEDYQGLFWRRPALAAAFTAMLLSLAGIPITGGFIGKFYLLAAGASSAMWGLIVTLAITSAIGLFYYLRIVVVMYGASKEAAPAPALALPGKVVLGILSAALILLGVFPQPLLAVIRNLSPGGI